MIQLKNLKFNLLKNKCKFKLISGNLLVKKKQYDQFLINKNFIANSQYVWKKKCDSKKFSINKD